MSTLLESFRKALAPAPVPVTEPVAQPTAEPTPQIREILRLDPLAYQTLRLKMPRPVVGAATTPTEAAYLLGIAYVLDVLRDGFVVYR